MSNGKYQGFENADPFFDIVVEGVRDDVDGDHFFDIMDENVVWEFGYPLPGTKEFSHGRDSLIELMRGFCQIIKLDSMSGLVSHKTETGRIIEYRSQGHAIPTGKPYSNRYISVLTIKNRKITHFLSYEGPLAALEALGGADVVVDAMHKEMAG